MAGEACQSYCLGKNYPLAGLEYSTQCYRGLSLGSNSTVGYASCAMACSGSSAKACGGSLRFSVYKYTNYVYPSSCRVWAHAISLAASPIARPRVVR
jgi:hypothetical protein